MNISSHQPVTSLWAECYRRGNADNSNYVTLAVPGAAILELGQQWQDATSRKLATNGMPTTLCDELHVAVGRLVTYVAPSVIKKSQKSFLNENKHM